MLGCKSNSLREYILSLSGKTMKETLVHARLADISSAQVKSMQKPQFHDRNEIMVKTEPVASVSWRNQKHSPNQTSVKTWTLKRKANYKKGLRNIADNIIVFGKSRDEHDRNLISLCKRLQQCGLTASLDNCKLGVEELTFFGLRFSKYGVAVNDDKVNALTKAKPPKQLNLKAYIFYQD